MAEDEDGEFDAEAHDDCVNWCPTCGHPANPVDIATIARLREEVAQHRAAAEHWMPKAHKIAEEKNAEVASLRAELAETRRDAAETIALLGGERDCLRAAARQDAEEIARLKEALEFYADPRAKIDPHLPGGIPDFYYELDFGERARTARQAGADRDVEIARLRFDLSNLTWTTNDNAVQIANLRAALDRSKEVLESIARYSPSSVVQPVLIARAALACRPQGERSET